NYHRQKQGGRENVLERTRRRRPTHSSVPVSKKAEQQQADDGQYIEHAKKAEDSGQYNNPGKISTGEIGLRNGEVGRLANNQRHGSGSQVSPTKNWRLTQLTIRL